MTRSHDGGLIRIFVSSTFVDFQGERSRLQTVVLPLLREQARSEGYDVAFVDLRWGLSSAVASKGGYIHRCLLAAREADLVLGLLGGRYGASPANVANLDLDQFQISGTLRDAIEAGIADRLSITHMELAYTEPLNRLAFQRRSVLTEQLERSNAAIQRDTEQPASLQSWTDEPGGPSADRAAALLRLLRDSGTPVLAYGSLDEFTALAREQLQSWLAARLATRQAPTAPAIPVIPHTAVARYAARTVWETGRLLVSDGPRSGKTVFLDEIARALEALYGAGAQPQILVHRLDLRRNEPPYRALATLLDTIVGPQVRLGLIDPLALEPQALLAIRRLDPRPVPVVIVDGMDDTLSEPPLWLSRLAEHVPLVLAGRIGPQMIQLRKEGWQLCPPPGFLRRDDAAAYLLARFERESKYLTPAQLEQLLDAKSGSRLGTIDRISELALGFGDLLPNEKVDEHVTRNLGWLLDELRLREGWDYALGMLLQCQPAEFTLLLTALAGLVVSRRGLQVAEIETVLGAKAERAGEVLVLLTGLLEPQSGRACLRDAAGVSRCVSHLSFLPGLEEISEQFWSALRWNTATRLLDRLESREGAATDEELADALHLIGEIAAIRPLGLPTQKRLLALFRAGAFSAALRTGHLTWLGSLIISRSLPCLDTHVLEAVDRFLAAEDGTVEDVLPLARFLHRHGKTGAIVARFAPAVAAQAARACLRDPAVGYSRERAALAWLALDEWFSLGRAALNHCRSVEEIEQLVEACDQAKVEMDRLVDLLDPTHHVAVKIHAAGLTVADMAARSRLQNETPDPRKRVAVDRLLGKTRRAISKSCWPPASTAELERRMAEVKGRLQALSEAGD